MTNWVNRTVMAAAMAMVCGVVAASDSMEVVTIRVVNGGIADRRTMSQARREAVRIFRHSGIDLVWLDCNTTTQGWSAGEPCGRERGATEFWVHMASWRPAATEAGVLAFTELDDRTGDGAAGVYYPAVVEMATKWRNRTGDVLGAAIAHEVGHLVLGANAHAGYGVMRSCWSRPEFERIGIGELNFAGPQSRVLRDRLAVLGRNSRR